MQYDGYQYTKIFHIIKNKIESGLIPKGSTLPSCSSLCKEYGVSSKTVRRVLVMLTDAGLIETRERKRPIVIFNQAPESSLTGSWMETNILAMQDVLYTAQLICYPLIDYGISMCKEADWAIPEKIVQQMDPQQPALFWRNSKLFWRFFIARCENELSLRTVDSLGFSELEYKNSNIDMGYAYRNALLKFVGEIRKDGYVSDTVRDTLLSIRKLTPLADDHVLYYVPADSPFRIGLKGLDNWMKTDEERYSGIYLDILGLIAIGYYRPGDRLPSHIEMQKQYGVSVNTTTQAIHILKKWGVVEAASGRGIFVSHNLQALNDIYIDPRLIASHIRRYLESVQILSLTVEKVARHAAAHVSPGLAQELIRRLESIRNPGGLYQPAPIILLEFIAAQIQYETLQEIYMVILKNYRIGRKIPKLMNNGCVMQKLQIQRMCINAAYALQQQDIHTFASQAAEMFHYAHRLIVNECKKFNYWEAVKDIYDGSQLWK